jgi:hypothetical protein
MGADDMADAKEMEASGAYSMDSSMRAKCCCKNTVQSKTLLRSGQISTTPNLLASTFEYFDD